MRKGQLTHQTILDESVQLASRLGLLGLSVGGLADEVEMSKSGLFAHFRSKEQLQLETLAHARSLFIDVIIRPTRKVPDGEPRLRALVDRWFIWADESLGGGCLFVAAAVELDDRPGPCATPWSPASASGAGCCAPSCSPPSTGASSRLTSTRTSSPTSCMP